MKIVICENEILPKVSRYCDTIIQAAHLAIQSEEVDGALNILFVDHREIRRMNSDFRDVDSVTDVLSFPSNDLAAPLRESDVNLLETDPETGEIVMGDIAICVDRAEEQALEYGHSLLRELCFLAVHGVYHLMGYDHMEAEGENRMTEKQERVLNQLGIYR